MHSNKSDRENALHFLKSINGMPPNYPLIPKNCLKFLLLLCNFIEITLRRGCSPVDLLHIFRTSFPENTSGRLLLKGLKLLTILTKRSILSIWLGSEYTSGNYHKTNEDWMKSSLKYKIFQISNTLKALTPFWCNEVILQDRLNIFNLFSVNLTHQQAHWFLQKAL